MPPRPRRSANVRQPVSSPAGQRVSGTAVQPLARRRFRPELGRAGSLRVGRSGVRRTRPGGWGPARRSPSVRRFPCSAVPRTSTEAARRPASTPRRWSSRARWRHPSPGAARRGGDMSFASMFGAREPRCRPASTAAAAETGSPACSARPPMPPPAPSEPAGEPAAPAPPSSAAPAPAPAGAAADRPGRDGPAAVRAAVGPAAGRAVAGPGASRAGHRCLSVTGRRLP